MKKKNDKLSPEEAVQFIEDMQHLVGQVDEPTVSISIRIPANILRAIKSRARLEEKKYQSLIVEYLRKSLKPTLSGRN